MLDLLLMRRAKDPDPGPDPEPEPTLKTQTFYGGSWTCPAGTSILQTLVGKGGDGSAASWTTAMYFTPVYVYNDAPAGYSAATLGAAGDTVYNALPNDQTGRYVSWTQHKLYSNRYETNSRAATYRVKPGKTKSRVRDLWFSSGGSTPPPYNVVTYQIQNMDEQESPGSVGANTSGFGYTFYGGNEVPASPITYYNIGVVPGSTYYFSVASGGYITITYYGI